VQVYKGAHHGSTAGTSTDEQLRANLISILYVPGHYQALVPRRGRPGPTLVELLATLDDKGVCYVLTDG